MMGSGGHEETTTAVANTHRGANVVTSATSSEQQQQQQQQQSPLLRSWRHDPPVPPVAPAVVVEEMERGEHSSSSAPRPSYPVATFVRDLVRTSIDQINHSSSQGNTRHVPMPVSVRSEGNLPSSLPPIEQTPSATALTVRTLNDLDDTEFILVDGDLIAVPPQPPNEEEREGLEDNLRSQTPYRACQPSRMRRGARRINKLLKRFRKQHDEKRKSDRSMSTGSVASRSSAVSPTIAGLSSAVEAEEDTSAAAVATIPTAARGVSPKRKTKRRPNKQKRSWRRQEDHNEEPDLAVEEHQTALAAATAPSLYDGLMPQAYAQPPSIPERTSEQQRLRTVTASFLGTADQLLEAGVLPAGIAAEAYVEFDENDSKKDDGLTPSLVPRDADYKVDKSDAPDVDVMLRRAAMEAITDLDASETHQLSKTVGKSEGESVPLSISCAKDEVVHNDMLKVVMVGGLLEKSWLARAIRRSTKRPRKRSTLGVDVHTWAPDAPVKFSIWDVQGQTCAIEGVPNFGGHPSTQSLFFSAESLYVLVWDLAGGNPKTHRVETSSAESDDEDEDEDYYDDDFVREEANRQADRALQADIQSRVLSWVDCIARRGPRSAILPVAVIPKGMNENEVKRRCDMMQNVLKEHVKLFAADRTAPKLLSGNDNILCVNYEGFGVEQLQETIIAIATDSSRSVFQHVGTPVPQGTALVLDTVRYLKQDHKLILLDHLLGEIGSAMRVEEVMEALYFLSSTGEILYFGATHDEVLSRYVILCRRWLVSALSCILRNDLKRELKETRRFMNMQALYSENNYPENEMTNVLVTGTTSSCPLLSDSDASMLWQSMNFMREAADRYSQFEESATDTPTMFFFLERLLVHSGIFMPLGASQSSLDRSEVFFVPSLLAQVNPRDIWTFKSSESWMTTLCHSWLFRQGAPPDLMERMTVSILRNLYDFSRSFSVGRTERSFSVGRTERPQQVAQRLKTVPMSHSSLHEFYEDHDEQAVGRMKIHQLVCWQSSILVKIGTVFADHETSELRESYVEILITLVDQSADHCVASDEMRPNMHRVVVSGKGQVGGHGRKLWEGGYRVVLDSVRTTLENLSNVDFQVVCPECLAHFHPHRANTWSWDSVLAAAKKGDTVVRCMKGHRVDSNLICGTCANPGPPPLESVPSIRHVRPVTELLRSVVLVGLWDSVEKKICSVGSGFIVDQKRGLVVTAGHIVFSMEEGRQFGSPYLGLRDAKVVIGLIPDDGHTAVFRYFASIVSDDIHSVDACVLRIRTRMENDVNDEGPGCADQPEIPLDLTGIQNEKLHKLNLTNKFELEESVRILGFNQGGEGVLEQGKHVNRSADFAKGYICKQFKAVMSDDSSSHSSDSSSHCTFSPREEIVIMCPTISGHSGGPCVNEEGRVIGILSRADPVDRQRCYLVPATEIKTLVNKARKMCSRPAMITSMKTL